MYNDKKYDISDAAQPALIGTEHGLVNPAYPTTAPIMAVIDSRAMTEDSTKILVKSLMKKLYVRRKANDKSSVKAINIMLKEIRQAEKDFRKWDSSLEKSDS